MAEDSRFKDLFDNAGYTLALAGFLATLGAACFFLADKQATQTESVLNLGWGYAALTCFGAAGLAALWSLVLFAAHRHNRRLHGVCTDPSVHRKAIDRLSGDTPTPGSVKPHPNPLQAELVRHKRTGERLRGHTPRSLGEIPSQTAQRIEAWEQVVAVALQGHPEALEEFTSPMANDVTEMTTNGWRRRVNWRLERLSVAIDIVGESGSPNADSV